jgi:hypothetical protein
VEEIISFPVGYYLLSFLNKKIRGVINMERERRIAIEILDEFEELLAEKDIKIPSNDRESDGRNEASLYGTEYYDLEDKITDIFKREFKKQRR